ncbi:helix-turn-helix transcriptional regulator [Catenulispora pinisilvae]|uniref:helix-turn-helix transcriptional regulator n=1 Tax=Catenulispora pinisilvae TaxID=2705253 RepID=UPI00189131D9|nr:WYL domain-containing protein [Catenulispora pinisilvae]
MNRPTGRVLTLLELLQSGGLRTSAELADRLGVDTRTVRRYVDHLLDLDIPVESVRGRYGGYRLARGYRLPPLMLGDDEALAVLLGLLAGGRSGLTAALGPAGETAAAKIRRVLPARLADRLRNVLDTVAFTAAPDQDPAPDATVLLTVSDAVAGHRPIAVAYTDRGGVRTDRTLHPYAIVNHRDRWYIRALDPAIGEERSFRLDRITGVRTLPGSFEPPVGDGDPAQGLLTGFATADYRYEVTIRVQGTAEQIRTRFPASVAILNAVEEGGADDFAEGDSGRTARSGRRDRGDRGDRRGGESAPWQRLEIRAERLDWIPATLAALDLPFQIERPAELRDLVLALSERLALRARPGLA